MQTNYTNMFQETTFDMCCHHKSVDGLDKQSGFSKAAVAQNCSVALERVKLRINNLVDCVVYGMLVSCCAVGCINRYGERPGLGFYRFPTNPKRRRQKWISAVNRKGFTPNKHTRLCGEYFVAGWLN